MILRVKRRKYAHGHLDYCSSSPKQGPLDCFNPLDLGLIQVDDQDLKNVMNSVDLTKIAPFKLFFAICHFLRLFCDMICWYVLIVAQKQRIEILPKNLKNLPEKRKQKYLSTNLIPKDQNVRKNHQKRMFLSKWATNIWKKTTKHSDITVQNHRAQS